MQLGLLGWPLSHSYSPKLHHHSAKILNIPCDYQLLPIKQPDLERFLKSFWDVGTGINVTSPYKSLITKILKSPLKAANTLYRGKKYWECKDTDSPAFRRALREKQLRIRDFDKIFILGGGAIVEAFLDDWRESPEVYVFQRRNKKYNRSNVQTFPFDPKILTQLINSANTKHSMLLQASSAPLHGEKLTGFLPESFQGFVMELNYNCISAIYQEALARGLLCLDGLSMLAEQARLSQELWWQKSLDFKDICNFLKKQKNES